MEQSYITNNLLKKGASSQNKTKKSVYQVQFSPPTKKTKGTDYLQTSQRSIYTVQANLERIRIMHGFGFREKK